MITLNKTIRLFLDSIGRRDEYEFYLSKFQSEHTSCFALLCPDLGSIEAGAEVLAFDLHFLLRLELVPAILLCGEHAAEMKKALSVEPIFAFQSLEHGSVPVFIQQSRMAEKIPVFVGEAHSLEESLVALLPEIANRVHFIRAAGGLKNESGELLPYLYTHKANPQQLEPLEFDYPGLVRRLFEDSPSCTFPSLRRSTCFRNLYGKRGRNAVPQRERDLSLFRVGGC